MQVLVEFQSLVDGRRFDVTGRRDANGQIALDEDIDQFCGPFAIFEADGLVAKFLGIKEHR